MKYLYKRLAKYYDLIYSNRDYNGEARFIATLTKKFKVKGKKILDVACGTASHSVFLKKMGYSITGLDINEEMLTIARKKLRNTRFIKADMRNFNFQEKFDIVICLFSSIHYNLSYKQLERTLKNFNKHLKDGGMIVFDMAFNKERWDEGHTLVESLKDKDLFLVRCGLSTSKNNIGILQLAYTIMKQGKLKFALERHKIKIFDSNRIKGLMEKLGFKAKLYQGFTNKLWHSRSKEPVLFIGIKRNTF